MTCTEGLNKHPMTEQLTAVGAYQTGTYKESPTSRLHFAVCFGCWLQAAMVHACTQHLAGVLLPSKGDSFRLQVVAAGL